MNKQGRQGIYLHIPFCRQKCPYCDFYSRAAGGELISSYVGALCSQIEKHPSMTSVGSLYFGGGTPSLLSLDQLGRIFSSLEKHSFLPDCEITLECNPENVTPAYAEGLASLGVNRISLGCQSFDETELVALGRRHTAADSVSAYQILRRYFGNISVDLMLGTPAQTEQSLEKSLSMVRTLQPDHVSAYLMKVYEKTVFGVKKIAEADEETTENVYLRTAAFLRGLGYEHYEISSYAREGKRSKHNLLYWTGGDYAAFGPGACGREDGVRYRIPPNTEQYINAGGCPEIVIEERETEDSVREEQIIFGLRISDGIEKTRLGPDALAYAEKLISAGLMSEKKGKLSLTERGMLVSNSILTELLSCNE